MVFLVMEYFPFGDLEQYIGLGLPEADGKLITAQLLGGLSIMHKHDFTHRDLKPAVSTKSPLKCCYH